MLWPMEDAADIMHWYRGFITKAPNVLNGFFAFLTVPPGPPFPDHLHNKKMCGIVWCFAGPLKNAERVFNPIRKFKKPALDLVGPIPHPALQSMFDALYPPGLQWYLKADFVRELKDEAIALHVKRGALLPTMHSTMHLYPINGKASTVKNTATPWSYRDAVWAAVMAGVDPDPANNEKISKWAKDYWTATHPYSAGGAYVNFLMDEGEDKFARHTETTLIVFILGGAGGWRQFRCCDVLSVQSTRNPYGLRGADALVLGRRSGDDALVPQLYPESASSIKRLFRFPNSSARATVSRTSAQQENVWHCVVLHWAS